MWLTLVGTSITDNRYNVKLVVENRCSSQGKTITIHMRVEVGQKLKTNKKVGQK